MAAFVQMDVFFPRNTLSLIRSKRPFSKLTKGIVS